MADAIAAFHEGQRLRGQYTALICRGHASLIGRVINGGQSEELWEVFPFWESGEVAHIIDERIRRNMLERVRRQHNGGG